jgi:hypothetical protein
MTYRPACEAAQGRRAPRSIKCWACNGSHDTIRLVQECHADLYDFDRERDAEAYAEGAYSRYLERRSYGYND